MRENRTSGSVRGVPGNGRSYRESHPNSPRKVDTSFPTNEVFKYDQETQE